MPLPEESTTEFEVVEPSTVTVVDHPQPVGTSLRATRVQAPKPRRGWIAVVVAFSLVLALLLGFEVGNSSGDSDAAVVDVGSDSASGVVSATDPVVSTALLGGDSGLTDASAVADAVVPSVVTVEVYASMRGQTVGVASGSGVIFDEAGSIITNAHVVEEGTSFTVVLSDGRVYPAELVGSDPTTDLAVLDIDASDLTPIAIGSSDAMEVGAPTIAVGSPLGLEGGPSVSAGILSAIGRTVDIDTTTTLVGMLQSDAPITQGSSGGALVNGFGELIGITSAVGVSEVGVEGIGFSTPVEIVTRVVDDILATGTATQPFLGIMGTTALEDTGDGGQVNVGVLIESVTASSAAETSGLSSGDVVTAVDGAPVETMEGLVALLRRHSAGDTIELTILGGASTLAVILGQR